MALSFKRLLRGPLQLELLCEFGRLLREFLGTSQQIALRIFQLSEFVGDLLLPPHDLLAPPLLSRRPRAGHEERTRLLGHGLLLLRELVHLIRRVLAGGLLPGRPRRLLAREQMTGQRVQRLLDALDLRPGRETPRAISREPVQQLIHAFRRLARRRPGTLVEHGGLVPGLGESLDQILQSLTHGPLLRAPGCRIRRILAPRRLRQTALLLRQRERLAPCASQRLDGGLSLLPAHLPLRRTEGARRLFERLRGFLRRLPLRFADLARLSGRGRLGSTLRVGHLPEGLLRALTGGPGRIRSHLPVRRLEFRLQLGQALRQRLGLFDERLLALLKRLGIRLAGDFPLLLRQFIRVSLRRLHRLFERSLLEHAERLIHLLAQILVIVGELFERLPHRFRVQLAQCFRERLDLLLESARGQFLVAFGQTLQLLLQRGVGERRGFEFLLQGLELFLHPIELRLGPLRLIEHAPRLFRGLEPDLLAVVPLGIRLPRRVGRRLGQRLQILLQGLRGVGQGLGLLRALIPNIREGRDAKQENVGKRGPPGRVSVEGLEAVEQRIPGQEGFRAAVEQVPEDRARRPGRFGRKRLPSLRVLTAQPRAPAANEGSAETDVVLHVHDDRHHALVAQGRVRGRIEEVDARLKIRDYVHPDGVRDDGRAERRFGPQFPRPGACPLGHPRNGELRPRDLQRDSGCRLAAFTVAGLPCESPAIEREVGLPAQPQSRTLRRHQRRNPTPVTLRRAPEIGRKLDGELEILDQKRLEGTDKKGVAREALPVFGPHRRGRDDRRGAALRRTGRRYLQEGPFGRPARRAPHQVDPVASRGRDGHHSRFSARYTGRAGQAEGRQRRGKGGAPRRAQRRGGGERGLRAQQRGRRDREQHERHGETRTANPPLPPRAADRQEPARRGVPQRLGYTRAVERGQTGAPNRLRPFQLDRGADVTGPQSRRNVRLLRHRMRTQRAPDAADDPRQPGEAGPQHEGERERHERAAAFPSGNREQGEDENQRTAQRNG